jgi:NAD(P)H-hydrate epimerase
MKVLDTEKIHETDAYTIQHEQIESVDLMERAALAFVDRFVEIFDEENKIAIVSGTGNNGGDGMAVGRLLIDKLYNVSAFVIRKDQGGGTEDFKINYEKLCRDIDVVEISKVGDIPKFGDYDIIIDSIFGSGLTRPVTGLHAGVIKAINNSGTPVASIDISSGLFCDSSSSNDGAAIKADITLSFQLPKLAFLLPENDKYVGAWELLDIGLDQAYIHRQYTQNFYVTREFLDPFVPKRAKHSHKGDYGKGLLVAGSYGKMGASILASRAYMRAGAGLLTILAPECGYLILQSTVPEAMVETRGVECVDDIIGDLDRFDAIGIGPGLGVEKTTVEALARLLKATKIPIVIDADGLNILAGNRHMLDLLHEHSILTPHPGEFQRLVGESIDDFSRIKKLREFATRVNSYVVLKGAHTAIATPEGNVYFNSTGNPGMATGGSGDVLTGIITSLLAQHQSPFHAAVLGVYLHGLAGDIAISSVGMEALIASDIIEFLPAAFMSLQEV